MRRVVVHVLHEEQGARAAEALGVAYDGGPTVEGEYDPDVAAGLREAGLVVETVEEDAAPVVRNRPRASVRESLVTGPAPERMTYTLEFNNALVPIGQLTSGLGDVLGRAMAEGVMTARLDRSAFEALDADPRLVVTPFTTSKIRLPDLDAREAAMVAPQTGEVRQFDVVAHSSDRLPEIEEWLALHPDVKRIGAGSRKVRVEIEDTSPLLDELDGLDAVYDVQPVPEVRFAIDRGRELVGAEAPGIAAAGLDGSGQIVGMTDGAVDLLHPDLAGRVALIGGAGVTPSAHGTHVAGLIAGSGTASQGKYRGMAPAATLAVYAVGADDEGAVRLPLDLAVPLSLSYAAGARIHNMSFQETGAGSFYSVRAEEVDAFAVSHPDMLIVIAAGNEARTEPPAHPTLGTVGLQRRQGEPDLLSIASPGIAKNALTVGACCSDRTDGGHPASTWAVFPPPGRFASPPTAALPLSGDASALAAFSGRGWGASGDRIKPDLVAPGTNIVGPRCRGCADTLWGVRDADYLYSGGTSMAAPIAAGAAALARQHLAAAFNYSRPSSALLKALLCAGATFLDGGGSAGSFPPPPEGDCFANPDQGFGRIDLARSLALDDSGRRLCFVDVDSSGTAFGTLAPGPVRALARDRDRQRFFLLASTPGPIDVALAYIDPVPGPAGAVLSLFVQPAGGRARPGNDGAVKSAYPPGGASPDRTNNLQIVRLEPTAGKVDIQISGLSLSGHTLGYALVVLASAQAPGLYPY